MRLVKISLSSWRLLVVFWRTGACSSTNLRQSLPEFTLQMLMPWGVDSHNNKIRGNEEWRDTVLLGSKLCSERDIANRCNKANVAFYTYKNLWLNSSVQICESRKLKLYEALVTSVLLYNCSSWGATKSVLDSVDVLCLLYLVQ